MDKGKIKEMLWKTYFAIARVLLTVLTIIAVTLHLWNWSYSTRGYGAIGGEIILAFIAAFVVWKAMTIIAEYHKDIREEIKKENERK